MKTKAFVQQQNGKFSNLNFYTASVAFDRFFGYEVVPFDTKDIAELPITKETPVYAGIGVFDKVLARFGKTAVVPYYPDELKQFMGRSVRKTTMKEIRDLIEQDTGQRFFIKPLEEVRKTFNGHIVTKSRDLIFTSNIPDETIIYVCEIVQFVTEYRCFIHKTSGVLGAKHYWGDWEKIPNLRLAKAAMKEYASSPIAYSLDLGLTDDGRTLLVECNDSTSLGCYGLDPYAFGKMITDRWHEIMK